MRLSSIDNVVVQEGIERVLQVCVRFIAVCRLFQQQENENENESKSINDYNSSSNYNDDVYDSNRNLNSDEEIFMKYNNVTRNPMKLERKKRVLPIFIPPEEIEGIRKDFFTQISYLFQVMRKVENRGLMFRLDFNGYLSTLSEEIGAGL